MTEKEAIHLDSKNRKKILKEIKKYKGTLVLDTLDIKKLIGFDEDEQDYYYVYKPIRGKVERVSCVCGFTPLKLRLKKDEYKCLERVFALNTDTEETKETGTLPLLLE